MHKHSSDGVHNKQTYKLKLTEILMYFCFTIQHMYIMDIR